MLHASSTDLHGACDTHSLYDPLGLRGVSMLLLVSDGVSDGVTHTKMVHAGVATGRVPSCSMLEALDLTIAPVAEAVVSWDPHEAKRVARGREYSREGEGPVSGRSLEEKGQERGGGRGGRGRGEEGKRLR